MRGVSSSTSSARKRSATSTSSTNSTNSTNSSADSSRPASASNSSGSSIAVILTLLLIVSVVNNLLLHFLQSHHTKDTDASNSNTMPMSIKSMSMSRKYFYDLTLVENDTHTTENMNMNINMNMAQIQKNYNATEYNLLVSKSMDPSLLSKGATVVTVPTGAWIYGFWGGFCNQYFTFLGIVFLSNQLPSVPPVPRQSNATATDADMKHNKKMLSNQIYIHSLLWKDLYGTEQKIRHDVLFDVLHWNSYYPTLPKLVSHSYDYFTDVYIHYDERGSKETVIATKAQIDSKLGVAPRIIWNATTSTTTTTIKRNNPTKSMDNATNPYPIGYQQSTEVANNKYKHFAKRLYQYHQNHNNDNNNSSNNSSSSSSSKDNWFKKELEQYKLIMKDALRPHPELHSIIHNFQSSIIQTQKYMVIHARIEPDMQHHPMCTSKKVINITHIIQSLYTIYPKKESQPPPFQTVILILNKELLEREVENFHNNENNNTMAVYNLQIVNDLLQNGLWDGYTNVIEAGSKVALESNHEIYSRYSTLVGGIINFFLALDATVFIGTEVSSYSTSVVNSRFYRHIEQEKKKKDGNGEAGKKVNYFYTPRGLHVKDSIHWFHC